jgi:hypothetical protein
MWDFVMEKSGAGAGFLRELRFPLPICIPSASPQSSSLSPEAGNSLTNQIKKTNALEEVETNLDGTDIRWKTHYFNCMQIY